MFERFTDAARRVVVNAQVEARRLKHDYIGTEHILLGLLAEEETVAAAALRELGISADAVRQQVVAMVGEGPAEPTGHIPFRPRAKKALELSLREALALKHNYIGPEHILLGILREGQGTAARALHRLGADTARVRLEVSRLLGEKAGEHAGEPPRTSRLRHTPAAAEVLATAEELAGGSPIGSHHLLEALARSHRSAAGHALAATGVDVEVLTATMDQLGLEGTTDLTPEEEAARQVEIRVDGDEVHIVLRDPGTVDRVRAITELVGGAIRGTDPVAGGLVSVHQAVMRYLERLQHRLEPTAEEAVEAETQGLSAVVRQAMRSRLRRRQR
jgi:ATP-dependent Clp protease ATP-binding subunit ClpA